MISESYRDTTDFQDFRKSLRDSRVAKTIYNYIGKEELACLMVLVSQVFWVIAYIYPNEHNFSPFETNLVRGVTAVIINVSICWYFGYDIDFKPSRVSMKSLNIRNFIITFHGVASAFIQFYLPLPVVHIIACSGSIFVCIIDYLRNGVEINREQIKGIIIGFIGIIFVINSDFILIKLGYKINDESQFQNYQTKDVLIITLAGFFLLFVTITWAYAVVETKNIKNINSSQISIHLGLCLLFVAAIFYPVLGTYGSITQILTSIPLTGIPMSITQLLFIGAFTMSENHGKLSVMVFSMVVTAYLISIFRYHEKLNLIDLMGIVLASFGVIKCILNKN